MSDSLASLPKDFLAAALGRIKPSPTLAATQKAREMKADLFVSIHADAFTSSDARGSSVWMLSPRGATSEAARFLADRENNSDLVGGVKLDKKDNTLAAVLLDLSQSSTIEASGVRNSGEIELNNALRKRSASDSSAASRAFSANLTRSIASAAKLAHASIKRFSSGDTCF